MDSGEFSSKLDRDSTYRITALQCAVKRAAQDGGIHNEAIDVLNIAGVYYSWLVGKEAIEPKVERKEIK